MVEMLVLVVVALFIVTLGVLFCALATPRRSARNGRAPLRAAGGDSGGGPSGPELVVPPLIASESGFERVLTVAFGLGPHPDDLRRAYLSVDAGDWLSLGADPIQVLADHFDTTERRVMQALRELPPG